MSEQEDHVLLSEEFGRYRPTAIMQVEVPGPAAVRRTVRRNQRRTLGAAVAAALTLVTGPTVGYAVLSHHPAPRPGPVDPTVSPSPTPTPSLSGSPTPTPPATTPAAPPPPDGHITRSQLLASPVSLPPWPSTTPECPSGRVRLSDKGRTSPAPVLLSLDHADVDRDGAAETVARVRCDNGDNGPEQVVAFDRDEAGRIVTLGRVASVPGSVTKGWLEAMELRSDGQVRLQLTDRANDVAWPSEWAQHQWRTYRWDGEGFDQVLGETAFPVNPYAVDLSVTSTDLRLTKNADGSRSGAIDVRIRHLGGRDATAVELRVSLQWGLFPVDDTWTSCRDGYRTSRDPTLCRLGPLRSGDDITLRLPVRVPQGYVFTGENRSVAVTALGPQDQELIERDRKNNEVMPRLG
ncbi:hypothetical protein V6U81_19985 [Micromonospora sp. CPCC 205711]|uniref:hypothetical protein n=1 Tax=Micromonospora sp. CPCC 205547 TaxID=3122400 RepID=UPI002FF09B54